MIFDQPQKLSEHIKELRTRLIIILSVFFISFFICYHYSQQLFHILVEPLELALKDQTGRRLIYTSLTEAFVVYIKVAFFYATLITFPVFLTQLWIFIAPGLYKYEKKSFVPFLIATPILFLIGGFIAYKFIFPLAFQFFLSFESVTIEGLPIQLEAKINEYLSLVMNLILAFGFAFELPVVLLLLTKLGILKPDLLIKYRRYAILIISIISAIITPPDLISMIGLGIPLYLLYEISILLIKWTMKKKKDITTTE